MLLEAKRANSGFKICVETAKEYEEVLRMAITAGLCSRSNFCASKIVRVSIEVERMYRCSKIVQRP